MVKNYTGESSIETIIKEVPRLTATFSYADNAGNEINRSTANVTTGFCPNVDAGEILVKTSADLLEHFRQVEFHRRCGNGEATANIKNTQVKTCFFCFFKNFTSNIQSIQIRVRIDNLATNMESDTSHIKTSFFCFQHQFYCTLSACTKLFIQIHKCRRIINAQTQKYSCTGKFFLHFFDFTGTIEGHFGDTTITTSLETCTKFDGISVNQSFATNTHFI